MFPPVMYDANFPTMKSYSEVIRTFKWFLRKYFRKLQSWDKQFSRRVNENLFWVKFLTNFCLWLKHWNCVVQWMIQSFIVHWNIHIWCCDIFIIKFVNIYWNFLYMKYVWMRMWFRDTSTNHSLAPLTEHFTYSAAVSQGSGESLTRNREF